MSGLLETIGQNLCDLETEQALIALIFADNRAVDQVGDLGPDDFADLNLGTSAGVKALYARIHAAARRVCEQPAGEPAAVRGCMTKAESDAIERVDAPLLTAFYQKKTGSQPRTITASS